ncbi:MAG: flagellar brake protein [Psychrobium sp.]
MQPKDLNVNEFMTHLNPGQTIDLQLGGLNGPRIKPTVIGLDIGRYLLVKFPSKLNANDYKDVMLQGNGAIVRYIVEGMRGECVAFSTTIQHISTVPDRLIFLNYPSKIENRQLRTHQREKTHLPAQISQSISDGKLAGNCISGYIVDISPRGCQFSFKQQGSNTGVKKCLIHIAISLVGYDEPLLVDAHVKNHRVENGHILVGIMFDDNSLDKIDALLDELSIAAD